MLFQAAPDSLDGIVLAVIWRIVRQTDVELESIRKLDHTLHKLRAPAVILRPIVLEQHQGLDQGKVGVYLAPAILKAINDKIAGYRPACEVEIEPIMIRQQDTIRRHFVGWPKIMIQRLDHQARLAATRVGADRHYGFGIQRQAQLGGIVLHRRTLDRKLLKDGVRFSRFF